MQADDPTPARFLPAGRTQPSLLAAEIARAAASPLVAAVLEASGAAAAVLDSHRQVVAFNTSYLAAAGVEEPAQVLGLRPGEALGCTYVERVSTGCGTTAACPSCGAALAIVAAMQGTSPAERR